MVEMETKWMDVRMVQCQSTDNTQTDLSRSIRLDCLFYSIGDSAVQSFLLALVGFGQSVGIPKSPPHTSIDSFVCVFPFLLLCGVCDGCEVVDVFFVCRLRGGETVK